MELSAEHTVIRSLRQAGDERQLTRLVVHLAQSDETFARNLMTMLLTSTSSGNGLPVALPKDARVRCHGERQLFNPKGDSVGRIDLILESEDVSLFVEVKLHSDYRPRQLADYLTGIRPEHGELLMAITRNISRFIEPPIGSPGWLGSTRWSRLMRALRKLSADYDRVSHQWNLLLDVLEEDGDMGSRKISRQLITAFEKSDDAWERLGDFLEQIGTLALPLLRSELAGNPDKAAAAAFARPRRRRPPKAKQARPETNADRPEVIYGSDQLYLAFEIPAGGAERLWIGFWTNDRTAWFYVAASAATDSPTATQAKKWLRASEALRPVMRGKQFYCNDDADSYVQVDYRLADFAKSTDVPQELAALVEDDLPKFVGAGLFE